MSFYPSTEAIGPLEPCAKLPDHLLWDELYPDETEALDLEEACRFQSSSDANAMKIRHLDEWSFDDLSIPASSVSMLSTCSSPASPVKSKTSPPKEMESSVKVNRSQQTNEVTYRANCHGMLLFHVIVMYRYGIS